MNDSLLLFYTALRLRFSNTALHAAYPTSIHDSIVRCYEAPTQLYLRRGSWATPEAV